MSFAVAGRRRAVSVVGPRSPAAGTGAPLAKPRFPKIVPHSLFVLYAPYPAPATAPTRPPIKAPLPAPVPPLAMAPPAAPRPAPRSPPRAPGLAMRQARSPPVAQSEAVVATGIGRGASTVARVDAGTTLRATTAGARRTGVGA